MDRRDFLKAGGAAAAVGSVFGELSPRLEAVPVGKTGFAVRVVDEYHVPRAVVDEALTKSEDATSIRYPESTLSVGLIAQWVIERLAATLPYPCVLADFLPEAIGGDNSWTMRGLRVGNTVPSEAPGREDWHPKQLVVLRHQVGVVLVAPSHVSEDRRETYDLLSDTRREVPVMVAEPVELAKLEVVVTNLRQQILDMHLDVFSAQMILPRVGGDVGPDCEAAETVVSRKLGLAVRVVRQCGREQLLMRFDLLGGEFPSTGNGAG